MSMFANPLSASPGDVQRKRQLAQQLLMNAQQTQPQTIGEGLGAVGDYIYAGRVGRAADAGDSEIRGKGNAILQSLLGGGMQRPEPAAPMQDAGVSVAQLAPPPGASGGNVLGVMPQVAPMQEQPRQPQQQGQNGRFMFTDVDTERLIELSMDPNVNQTLEYIGAGSVLKMANDEIKRRWDYMTEQEKQQFQLYMQDRGFDQQAQQQLRGFEHDRGMVGLRSRSDLESEAIKQGYGSVEEMQAAGGTVQAQKFRLENQDAQRKRELSEQQKQGRADLLTQEIDRALDTMDKSMTTGAFAPLANLPGTDARSLAARLDTIKANIGFDQLNAMRASSPTGGALGNVTERELAFLQAVAGSLDQAQSAQELQDNLNRLWNSYMDVIHGPGQGPERRQLSFEKKQGESGGWTVEQVD